MQTHLKITISMAFLAFAYTQFTLASELSWPQSEMSPSQSGFSESGIEKLDQAMREIVKNQDVAGMVWMLAKDAKVVTLESAGFARLDDQIPMRKDTLFRIYSMTKPVTGVALMILHEQGLWKFDDPVSKFIPEFKDLQVMESFDEKKTSLVPMNREPTMRELLNHSAGFGYGLRGDDPVNNAYRQKRVLASSDLTELVDKVAQIPLLSQPGEQWYYSIAVDIQGYIVQKLTGMSYGSFLEEHIFEPLKMTDTSFFVKQEDQPRFAEIHNWDSERNRLVQRPHRQDRLSYLDPSRLESGGGGLVSSIHDYARFLQMLVNEGSLEGARILTPESVRIMRTNSLRDELDIRGGPERPGQAGVGFGVDFAVIYDPELANSPQGPGTYYWSGAAGTWFWIDPSKDMFWIGMIQAWGQRRPGSANMRGVVTDLVYDSLKE